MFFFVSSITKNNLPAFLHNRENNYFNFKSNCKLEKK